LFLPCYAQECSIIKIMVLIHWQAEENKFHLHNFRELKIKLLTWHYEISQDSISVK